MLTLKLDKTIKFLAKITKKIGLGLVSICALFLGFGCTNNFTATNSHQEYIHLGVPFYKNGPTYLSLEKIVKAYNQLLKSGQLTSTATTLLPVRIQKYNGYEDLHNNIMRKLQIKDFHDLPSLVITYPNLLPFIASAGKELELNNIKRDLYQESFLNFERSIQGLPNYKNWLLPFGFSSDVIAINSSNFGFLIQEFLKYGAKILPKDQEFFEKIIAKGSKDHEHVTTLFGEAKFRAKTLEEVTKLVFSREMFQSFEKLIEFAILVKQVFPKFDHPIIALDAPSNLIYALAFAKLGNKMKNFLFTSSTSKQQTKNTALNFSNVFASSSQQYKVLSEIFQILNKGNAFKVFRIAKQDKDYATQDFVTHKLVFSVASSAGYKYYFLNQAQNDPQTLQANEVEALPAPQKLNNQDKWRAIYLRGPVMFGISLLKHQNEAALHFLKWFQQTKSWSVTIDHKAESFNKTPANYLALEGNYITIEKAALQQNWNTSKEKDLFYKTVFQEFSKTLDSSNNLVAFREPVAVESEIFKKSLNEALRQVLYDRNSNFEDFLMLIRKNL